MQLESVNRSRPRPLMMLGREHVTGIAKEPAAGPVEVTAEGLAGDGVGNTADHGGPDQALYLYGLDEYRSWAAEDGLAVRPGLFGENLTLSELASASVEVGDRFRLGEVELEATAPRIPCGTLSARVGDGRFASRFAEARRPGAYVRVVAEGVVTPGLDVVRRPAGSGVTLGRCMDAYYDPALPGPELDRLLAAPLASRLRTLLERRRDAGRP